MTIMILNGRDRGKYAKVTKTLPDGNLSVRLESRIKVIVQKDNFVEVSSDKRS